MHPRGAPSSPHDQGVRLLEQRSTDGALFKESDPLKRVCNFAVAVLFLGACSRAPQPLAAPAPAANDAEWRSYGHDAGGMRFCTKQSACSGQVLK